MHLQVLRHAQLTYKLSSLQIGRYEEVAKIDAYLCGQTPGSMVVVGAPGSGKTALMARAAAYIRGADCTPRKRGEKQRHTFVATRFVATTPNSTNARSVMRSLCYQIGTAYRVDYEISSSADYRDVLVMFRQLLASAWVQ